METEIFNDHRDWRNKGGAGGGHGGLPPPDMREVEERAHDIQSVLVDPPVLSIHTHSTQHLVTSRFPPPRSRCHIHAKALEVNRCQRILLRHRMRSV